MSEKNSNEKHRSKKHSSDIEDETLYNTVKREDRKQKAHDEDEMEEFNSWTKKYNFVAKEIRKKAIDQEKEELENLKKSPMAKYKYFEGSREDRILQLKEERKLLEDMEKLSQNKGRKEVRREERTKLEAEDVDSEEVEEVEDEREDPDFRKMRKKYHETSKEMRKKSLNMEKDELNKAGKEELEYVPGSHKDRVETISGEVKGLERTERLALKKKSSDQKVKKEK